MKAFLRMRFIKLMTNLFKKKITSYIYLFSFKNLIFMSQFMITLSKMLTKRKFVTRTVRKTKDEKKKNVKT